MQQRLGLARVLIHDPQLLLLDEPASGLDPRARIEVMAILQELQRMGKTIIISSHILSELQTLCNRVAIIEKGKMIYQGPVQGLRTEAEGQLFRVRVATGHERAMELCRGVAGVMEVKQMEDGDLRVHLGGGDPDPSALAEVLVNSGLRLTGLRQEEVGLEEVFMRVTQGETQ
jgi:ABC-2 type transport system ATP-binding protein